MYVGKVMLKLHVDFSDNSCFFGDIKSANDIRTHLSLILLSSGMCLVFVCLWLCLVSVWSLYLFSEHVDIESESDITTIWSLFLFSLTFFLDLVLKSTIFTMNIYFLFRFGLFPMKKASSLVL